LATVIALSNSEIAPSTWRTSLGYRRIVDERARTVCCDQVDAPFAQLGVTNFGRFTAERFTAERRMSSLASVRAFNAR
jgi:hypothetical protein